MLSKCQIEEIGRLVESREKELEGLIASLQDNTALMDIVVKYVNEYELILEIEKVLAEMYHNMANVDADTLGEAYMWLQQKQQQGRHFGRKRDEEKYMIGYLQGKIDAGYVTQADWDKLQELRFLS